MAGGYVLGGRSSLNAPLLGSLAFLGAVLAPVALLSARFLVELYEVSVIHVSTECVFDGFQASAVAVSCDLHPVGWTAAKIVYEGRRVVSVATTNPPKDDQLGFAVQRSPGPDVSSARWSGLGLGDILLFGVGD